MSTITPEERDMAIAQRNRKRRDAQALKQYEEREHLRGEIPSRYILQRNAQIMEIMYKGQETVETASGELITQDLDRTRIAALKACADIGFRMLSKTIPDLKQIEMRADVTEEALPQRITYTVIRPEYEDSDDDD